MSLPAVIQDEDISQHFKLVHYVLRKYHNIIRIRRLEYDDLFQVGCIGLLKAIRKFDPEITKSMSTYAVPMIRGAINNYLRGNNYIHVPRTIYELSMNISRKRLEDLTPKEIADVMGCSENLVKETLEYMSTKVISSETPLFEKDGRTVRIEDMFFAKDDTTPVIINEFVGGLNQRERDVLHLTLGGNGQREISERIGCSQPTVGRILKRVGLRYLKEAAAQ